MTLQIQSPSPTASLVQTVDGCYLCGRQGTSRYTHVRDHTFGAPGEWNYMDCESCGLMWLNPRPVPDVIGDYYRNYYTHGDATGPAHSSSLKERLKASCVAARMRRRELAPDQFWCRLLGRALVASTLARESADLASAYVADRPPGKVLDVGCGNGVLLKTLQKSGWSVEGVEPDAAAAKIAAKELGREIRCCSLPEANYPDQSFDLITMFHVIEHVYDPIGLLLECRSLLRPGASIVIVTPNVNSFGHSTFGKDWRGLEPPRHLYLFSPSSLQEAANRADLRATTLKTACRTARGIWAESHHIHSSRTGATSRSTPGWLAQAYESLRNTTRKYIGEEIVLIASRE